MYIHKYNVLFAQCKTQNPTLIYSVETDLDRNLRAKGFLPLADK